MASRKDARQGKGNPRQQLNARARRLPQSRPASRRPLLRRLPGLLALVCVAASSSLFLTRFGLTPSLWAASAVSMALLFAPAALSVWRASGPGKAALLFGALGLLSLLFESLSILTGIPYGRFHYGEAMGPKALGLVPWTVFFAWSPLVVGAWVLVSSLIPAAKGQLRILLAALLLVLFDLAFDPVAVALGMWAWASPGAYYGIPLSNFIGWLLTGLIGAGLSELILAGGPPGGMASLSLLASSLLWTSCAAFLGLFWPAAAGGLLSMLAAASLASPPGSQRKERRDGPEPD